MGFLTRALLNALSLLLVTRIAPGALRVEDVRTLGGMALLLTVANTTLRPMLRLFALPFNVLTLGLATFGVDALLLALVVWVLEVPHGGFLSLLAVSALLSVLNALWTAVVGP